MVITTNETMKAIDYLEQYKYATRRAERLRMEYEREMEMIDSVRSTADIDGMPHGTGVSRKVEDRAIRLADKAMEWKMAELDALHIRQEIFETVQQIGGLEAEVLTERYLYGKTWREVCRAVNYSWAVVHPAWHRGMDKLGEILGDL